MDTNQPEDKRGSPRTASGFFDPGPERARKVAELFGRIARRYDLINDIQSLGLHRRWKRRLVELARPRRGEWALDVCCGTGDLALLLASKGLSVTGLDFSAPMLEIAAQRTAAGGVASKVSSSETTTTGHDPGTGQAASLHLSPEPGSITFVRGDALHLPFPDGTFDIVTVGYGLRNLADWEQGLAEMRRVAKPGGRLLVLDFGKPDNPVWCALYVSYLRVIVPIWGWLFCGNAAAYAYIVESLQHYAAQQGVAAKMRQLGLARVSITQLLGGAMSINYGEVRQSVN